MENINKINLHTTPIRPNGKTEIAADTNRIPICVSINQTNNCAALKKF